MNALLERTDKYLNAEWRGSAAPWKTPKTGGAFVTISRQSGSGGSSLARMIAREMNGEAPEDYSWSIFEGSLPVRMLRDHHLPTRIARFLPEDRISEINASVGELVGLHPSLWDLVQKMNQTMRDLAHGGHVILVGRGANFATAGLPRGVNVRLVAPAEHRANYRSQLYDISTQDALAYNAKCDAARRRYVKSTFNADPDDPSAYDLVINTAVIPLARAARMVCALVRDRIQDGS